MTNVKRIALFGCTLFTAVFINAGAATKTNDPLKFNPDRNFEERTLTLLSGKTVKYRAYEHIYYVADVADSAYQYLNIYVPESAYNDSKTAIIFRNTIGGYMAGKPSAPNTTDITGPALQEGYVVVVPGARGWNSKITKDGKDIFTGRAPAAIIDLKAAVRYLRHNDAVIPGSSERIISDGWSAGGAMSALLGATGNNPLYEPYLKKLGAAHERDDIFAVLSFCPITDLDHADMAYEWLYKGTDDNIRNLSAAQKAVSEELAAAYPAYLNSLGLKKTDGTLLTADNYMDYIKSFLIQSAQKAKDEANVEFPARAGIKQNKGFRGGPGDVVTDIDMDAYLKYVAGKQALKTPPAFDHMDVVDSTPTFENNEFGGEAGNSVNFTDYSVRKAAKDATAVASTSVKENVHLMNPMNFIGDGKSKTAPHWYIRHGAIDRDTGFPVAINLYTKLINDGCDANFALAWNRPHSGDYNLKDVFDWITKTLNKAG